ncbi:glycoside hydrolase family 2 protein [Polaribacter sp. IC073]|uniref:glycoside hydrolase family 2 protein n=1 Tax=Polaribacter sp. IC073 TaxID=2508540 RepID=UPI0011BE8DA6|nr:glycoside hydrolase family 2 TIM barrel-domain containing protein [Polaribacter sp. IC073]TXD46348.1 glycoside hydrolase family 2 protein [Polaribacter sp. IC073]
MFKKICTTFCFLFLTLSSVIGQHQPEFSKAGFYPLENTGREAFSMNVAWRFHKGPIPNAESRSFNDKEWAVVNLPNGIEYLPEEASGGANYQGEVWYRKHFTPDNALKGKKLFLHFEAIMGKSKVFVNGKLLKMHFGGYLPVIVDVSEHLNWNKNNVIAVWADNSNDPAYPPGKAQEMLDFSYFGGIYRDCWLVAHDSVFITNPNYEDVVGGGGFLMNFENVSTDKTTVKTKLHIKNETSKNFLGKIKYEWFDAQGKRVLKSEVAVQLNAKTSNYFSKKAKIKTPTLWSPENPYLYQLHISILNKKGKVVDGYRKRIGIKSVEFKGKDGFWLNGKPYGKPLMGANRHQDFAVVGNALSNNIHWRDAKKLRDVGLKLIRNAHYPQDPAFMDACDELGLFVIVNTPGWQFWNNDPSFEQYVYSDIRNMVRRDRNRPSIWLWEPILNETWYPDAFALNTKKIVEAEMQGGISHTASDLQAKGSEHFPVIFTYPLDSMDMDKNYYTREWGDNVDDWNSHNSPSRVHRSWGERPMLVQALHYSNPPYNYISYNSLYKTSPQHMGGALWHSFDHQRGYHPDPFYGGIMDAYRQPKYSYEMFKAQRSPEKSDIIAETGPMIHIANQMTPFSDTDVMIFSNAEEVKLTVFKDGKVFTHKKDKTLAGMPSPPIVFKDAYHFLEIKALHRKKKQKDAYLLAEGFINGKLVATDTVLAVLRPEKIILWVDDDGVNLKADGSDFVTVIAAITDKSGNIKRLNNSILQFEISGEGTLIGDKPFIASPRQVNWGTAPILVQSTTKSGKITVKASLLFEGSLRPIRGEITFKSLPTKDVLLFDEKELAAKTNSNRTLANMSSNNKRQELADELIKVKKELNDLKLKKVEKQQEDFGEKSKDN